MLVVDTKIRALEQRQVLAGEKRRPYIQVVGRSLVEHADRVSKDPFQTRLRRNSKRTQYRDCRGLLGQKRSPVPRNEAAEMNLDQILEPFYILDGATGKETL